MRKQFMYFFLLCSISSFGHDVSETLAVKMANYYYQMYRKSKDHINTKTEIEDNRKPELISPLGKADIWLVPVLDGWMLISSSTKVTPILAYMPSCERLVYDSLPSATKELINSYEQRIAYVNEHDGEFAIDERWLDINSREEEYVFNRNTSETVEYIGPLLTTRWNQSRGGTCNTGKIYNKFCPYVNDSNLCYKAVAGCWAVAIAQVMNYWNWPYTAQIPTTVGGVVLDQKFYDWSKMPDSISNYTSIDCVDMVAGLLRDCGYRLNMDYGVESAAYIDSAYNALWQTFGYNHNSIELLYRNNTSNWISRLQSNIDNGQPILYKGQCGRGHSCSHAFVLDGYCTGSHPMFHVNWGWGGHYDCWCSLDSVFINDTTHYESHQAAIMGIKPAPICSDVTLNYSFFFPPKFCYAIGGELTVSNATLNNIIQGQLYSTTQVRLTSGVTISEGSNVHIAIKDVPCPSIPNSASVMAAPAKKGYHIDNEKKEPNVFSLSPNPVASILHFNMCDELSHAKIYTINGQCVMQASQTDIDVSALPQGMYILRAETTDGNAHQTKFIKQ